MTTVTLTDGQADRAVSLCDEVRALPGAMIAHFDWYTADAFWAGYLHALQPDAVVDFRDWGRAHLGDPGSNTSPILQLRRVHGLPGDRAGDPAFDRARTRVIAGLVCDLVEAYVHARRRPAAS